MRVLDVDARDAADHADAFDRLRRRELAAIVVHHVMDPAEIAALLSCVAEGRPQLPRSSFPAPFRSGFHGYNLNLLGPRLDGYFEEAAVFNARLAELPPRPEGLVARITSVLSRLDHGARFDAPPGPVAGQRYMFTTLRDHHPGGYIPLHFDNEMRLRPSYRHLASLVEHALLSFVLALTCAEAGGALEVFDVHCDPSEARLISDDHAPPAPATADRASVRFRLPAGSMIVVDSGRLLHRLTRVEGSLERWTVCSFMARSLVPGGGVHCWG